MKTVTSFPHAVEESPDIGIVLSDDCRLSARIWKPETAHDNPVPAILEYIPYRKRDGTLPRDEGMHPYFAGHGYAAVRVDMRGSGDSDGILQDEYTAQELADACEVIAWLAAQPWCSGNVGMMGKSWGGFNCLQTAALRPPALKAVVSVCSSADRFADDIHFKGGCLLGENFGWGTLMLSYMSRPPDPALRADWREAWLQRLEAMRYLAPIWAGHQARDGYWRHGSVCEAYGAVQTPVLAFGGWADNYMNTVSNLVTNVEVPCKGIVGPWVHQYPHTAVPGPQIGFLQEALRWWDRWLKGIENGAEDDPAMRAYMLASAPPDACAAERAGHWVAKAEWPEDAGQLRLHLTDQGLAEDVGPLAAYVSTPQHLGLSAGEFFPMGLTGEMPGDQAEDDRLSVCFDTTPLKDPCAMLGAGTLHLRLRCDAPQANLVVRLCDVDPEGRSVRIAHGLLNLCHRDSREDPSPVPTDRAFDVTLTLDHMAYRVAAGHRLRFAVSTSYWPFIWPSATKAVLQLEAGTLTLPRHDGPGQDEWDFPGPEAAPTWNHKVLREGSARRVVEHDIVTGLRHLIAEDDSGTVENLDHGLITGHRVQERMSIHPDDPLSARSDTTWVQTLARGEWSVRTEVTATMRATHDALVMDATVTAFEGDAQVFARTYSETVARRFL